MTILTKIIDGETIPLTPEEIIEFEGYANQIGPPPPVVSKSQAKKALNRSGLLSSIDQAISEIEDPVERGDAEIDWATSGTVERDWPLVQQLKTTLNLTEEDLDNLFYLADTL